MIKLNLNKNKWQHFKKANSYGVMNKLKNWRSIFNNCKNNNVIRIKTICILLKLIIF